VQRRHLVADLSAPSDNSCVGAERAYAHMRPFENVSGVCVLGLVSCAAARFQVVQDGATFEGLGVLVVDLMDDGPFLRMGSARLVPPGLLAGSTCPNHVNLVGCVGALRGRAGGSVTPAALRRRTCSWGGNNSQWNGAVAAPLHAVRRI
jgi:hypothetical protein